MIFLLPVPVEPQIVVKEHVLVCTHGGVGVDLGVGHLVKIESIFSTPNLNLEAVWNFGRNNNDAAGSLLYCCDVSALFRFFKSRTPHFGHSVDECTRSMDLSVSVRSALHSEQKYCTSAWS